MSRKGPAPPFAPTGPAARGLTILLIADFATLGALGGQLAVFAALSDPDGRDLVGRAATSSAGGLGMMLGLAVALGYAVWPMMSVRDGDPAEVGAFRILRLGMLGLHPSLLACLLWDWARFGSDAVSFVFLPAPVCVLATPLLLPVAGALSRTAAPGFAARPSSPRPAPARAEAAPMGAAGQAWLALLLPFVAPFQAGRPAWGVLSALLWCGALLLLFLSPIRAVVPFALAYGIGWRAAQAASPPPHGAPPSAAGSSLPLRVVRGLLCVPPLFVLDALAAAVLLALRRADTLGAFAGMVEGSAIVLIVALIFTLLPAMVFLPLDTRASEATRPAASLALAAAHMALTATFAAVSFEAPVLGGATTFARPVYVLIAPLTWALALAMPMALLLASSARRFGQDAR